ncbi:hypothetical protein KC19_7G179400 [Ceratodon purpureus]|uniref:Sec1 family domain-containing protein 2 n=1 Tax=Ceratodon purpureus TaxID=3225 RepID=A0A8T0H7V3_CERPU|nr:hypothetical protein KC19_7G179400 [Ceratodon purpureus]
MGVDLVRECQRCLAQVADEVEGGLLYVDEGAGEALHYMGGLPFVLQLGVRSVCSLENASPLDAAVAWQGGRLQKVVVLTARLLSDAHRYILRCLRCHPNVRKCTIFTSISQEGHSASFETPLGHNAFSEYRSLLQQDLQSSARASVDGSFSWSGSREKPDDLELIVRHAPLLMCALTPNLFVLPSGGAEAEAPLSDHKTGPSLGPGLPAIDTGVVFDVDDRIPSGASLVGHFLQQLTAQLDLKVDVFSLGPLSHLVGNLVTDLSSSIVLDHGSQRKSAGLLLVDRSLDLVTPTCHNDNFMDRAVYSLLRRPTILPPSRPQGTASESQPVARKPMDFRVPIGSRQSDESRCAEFPVFPLMPGWDCKTQRNSLSGPNESSGIAEEDKAHVMGGSLATSWDQFGLFNLEALLDKSTKDATLMLRKWFHEALRHERQPVPAKARLGAMTSAELASLQAALSAKPDTTIRQLDLLQVARAMEEILSGVKRSKWEAVSSAEKILRLSVNDGSQSIALQLSDIVQQISHDGMLDLSDVLTLAIVGYALAGEASPKGFSSGPFAWQEEAVLTDSILDAVWKGPADLGFSERLKRALESQWKRSEDKSTRGVVEEEKLVKLNTHDDDGWGEWEGVEDEESDDGEYGEGHLKLEIRDRLQEVMSTLHCISRARARLPVSLRSTEEQVFPTGLLQQVFSLIFSKSDVPGLHHHISSVGRFFKSGLGRFGLGQPKPKLGDYKLIIVFVVGGISGTEIRGIKEAQAGFPGAEGVEVLIGGTTFLSPSDMRELLFGLH